MARTPPGRFVPPMALMKATLWRGELEVDGGLELEGGTESIRKASGLCQALSDFEATHELPRGYRSVLRDCVFR
ncbi:hypothetical protein llap_19139 [Limosa lapponica baueri]|uniref:Uncharacterized protein n=1 Tax=Limosa lapponica baueri TaxID=1758121 RepID=A0A2I0T9T3_LIMLA|nr:hypothetical protein llap_19139 [Limosa lapponica baueri]